MENKMKDRIRTERKLLDLNQPELAKIMNVSKQTVSNWENGNRIPDAITIDKLADLFNCSTDYLFGRTDERNILLCEYETTKGDNLILGVSKDIYPNGLTKEEIIEKLKIIKMLEDSGVKLQIDEQD